jgi:hypothetical protein
MKERKYTRFETQDNAYAALRGQETKIGKISDISANGVAFRYLAEEKSTEEYGKADIFLSQNGFHLSDVPCSVVYDREESPDSSYGIKPYRCGLMFDQLEGESQERLDYFISHYTTGEV